jgi:rod shape-determining protein MreD
LHERTLCGGASGRCGPEQVNGMEVRTETEQHIEVYKFHAGVITGAVLLALVVEAFLVAHFRWADLVELPLLVTIYFALSRRNPSAGLLLGMVIGLLQDSLSHTPLGLYGIAKTLVGFFASSFGSRIDVEHPVSRFFLTAFFFYFHNSVLVLTERLLLAQQEPYFTRRLLIASLVNAVLAVLLFPLLDRLRKQS